MNRCDVIDLLEDRYGINKDNLTKRELAIIGVCTGNYTRKDEAELNLHLVSKRNLPLWVRPTIMIIGTLAIIYFTFNVC